MSMSHFVVILLISALISFGFMCVVVGIGKLFHFYMLVLSPPTKHKTYLSICDLKRNRTIENPRMDRMIDKLGDRFFFFVLYCLFPLSSTVRKEEGFALSVFLKSRGLSNDGLDQLSWRGVGQASRQFSETRKIRVDDQRLYLRSNYCFITWYTDLCALNWSCLSNLWLDHFNWRKVMYW